MHADLVSTVAYVVVLSVQCVQLVQTTSLNTHLQLLVKRGPLHLRSHVQHLTCCTDSGAKNVVNSWTILDRVSAVVVTAWPNTGDQPPTQDRGTLPRLLDNTSDCQVTAGVTVRPWSLKLADRRTILSVSGASKCGSVGTIVSNQRDSTLEVKHMTCRLKKVYITPLSTFFSFHSI